MKLSFLYEYLEPYGPGVKFYGDPLWKNKTKGSGSSHLVGGSKDRDKFLGKMNKKKRKKKKKK